ncbi:MAG: hypothetical protein EBZ48_16950 [Proteobacteria bacterium]|nr:hypothetical protein [Pseudomonadota bacterium]
METDPTILAAREKLKAKFAGGVRRKKKAPSAVVTDDKKLQGYFKRIGAQPLAQIEEVNIFLKNGEVTHFTNPRMQAAVSANTFVVTGASETKPLHAFLPRIMPHLSPENMAALKQLMQAQQQAGAVSSDADVPDLVQGANFEQVSKA